MGGPVNMSVDHLIGNTGGQQNNLQEGFVTVYNFLNTQFTRIASNFGNAFGGLDGTGFNYWDAGSGHAGQFAWAVFRTNGTTLPAYNIWLVWTFGTATEWTIQNSAANDYVGFAAAILDTGADAWNGTTVNTGSDTVGSPRWDIGGASTIFTFNWYNEPNGARVANRDDHFPAVGVLNAGADRGLLHMWADDDSFLLVYDDDLTGTINSAEYVGPYDLLTGITHDDNLPVVGISEGNTTWWLQGGGVSNVYGEQIQEGGGLLAPKRGGVVPTNPSFHFDTFLDSTESTAYQPNRQLDTPAFAMPRQGLVNRQTALIGHVGYLPTWIRYGHGLPPNARNNTTPDRAFFGNPADDRRGVLPWHTGGPPGANAARAGVQATWNGP